MGLPPGGGGEGGEGAKGLGSAKAGSAGGDDPCSGGPIFAILLTVPAFAAPIFVVPTLVFPAALAGLPAAAFAASALVHAAARSPCQTWAVACAAHLRFGVVVGDAAAVIYS